MELDRKGVTRRRVLSGTLAAPVVLTVSSPAAAATSFARCLANTNDATVAGSEFFSSAPDNWYRAQVPVSALWSQGQDLGLFYDDPLRKVFVNVKPPYAALTFNAGTMPNYVKVSSQSTRWALVWFDEATTSRYKLISLQRPSGASATSMSCYGSFTKV